MHVGNLRTALYAYLIAKHEGGDFILRIEDTDQERYVEGAVDIINRTMQETGLIPDESPDLGGPVGPYVQSERVRSGLYLKYAKELIEKGEAYYCFCTPERLESLKQVVDGKEISSLNKAQLTAYRRHDVGFVFQFYNLIPNLTALENIEIAAKLSPRALDARKVLAQVGLKDRAKNFPAQLSGGEQQRIAIARALAKNPKLLLCDEPTGALDYHTGKAILKLLQDTSRRQGMTVIIITHNKALCDMADRVIRVKSGTVQSVSVNPHATPIEEIEW